MAIETVTYDNFADFESSKDIVLVKPADRNGTRIYANTRCPHCGGSGYLSYYAHIEGGICFLCNGTGRGYKEYKVYTPEYFEKLQARRHAKARKEAAGKNRELCKQAGLDEGGNAYVVMGNTFSVKDSLKAAGARYTKSTGWYFGYPVEGYDTEQICVVEIDSDGQMTFDGNSPDLKEKVNDMRAEYTRKHDTKAWIGEVGKRMDLSLTFVKQFEFTTNYCRRGYCVSSDVQYMYTFEDENHNCIVWRTTTECAFKPGETAKIRGTVKEHGEYKGNKQTVLTRCKVL